MASNFILLISVGIVLQQNISLSELEKPAEEQENAKNVIRSKSGDIMVHFTLIPRNMNIGVNVVIARYILIDFHLIVPILPSSTTPTNYL
jgi:hypothetical protein